MRAPIVVKGSTCRACVSLARIPIRQAATRPVRTRRSACRINDVGQHIRPKMATECEWGESINVPEEVGRPNLNRRCVHLTSTYFSWPPTQTLPSCACLADGHVGRSPLQRVRWSGSCTGAPPTCATHERQRRGSVPGTVRSNGSSCAAGETVFLRSRQPAWRAQRYVRTDRVAAPGGWVLQQVPRGGASRE